jgi:hypothetical protein
MRTKLQAVKLDPDQEPTMSAGANRAVADPVCIDAGQGRRTPRGARRRRVSREGGLEMRSDRKKGRGGTDGLKSLDQLTEAVIGDGVEKEFEVQAAVRGERRLLLALLYDAVCWYQKYMFAKKQLDRRLFQGVQKWFRQLESRAPISFQYVCDILHVDPDYFRRGLKMLRGNQSANAAVPKKHRLSPRPGPVRPRGRHSSPHIRNGFTRSGVGDEGYDRRLDDHEPTEREEGTG